MPENPVVPTARIRRWTRSRSASRASRFQFPSSAGEGRRPPTLPDHVSQPSKKKLMNRAGVGPASEGRKNCQGTNQRVVNKPLPENGPGTDKSQEVRPTTDSGPHNLRRAEYFSAKGFQPPQDYPWPGPFMQPASSARLAVLTGELCWEYSFGQSVRGGEYSVHDPNRTSNPESVHFAAQAADLRPESSRRM